MDSEDLRPTERVALQFEPPPDRDQGPQESGALTSHDVVCGLMEAVRPISEKSRGGSHTQVLLLVPDRLERVLARWIDEQGRDSKKEQARIEAFSRRLAERYLLKVGNIELFTMRLGGSREAVLPRAEISEVFGPIGYNLHPSFDKAVQDSLEACREIPYFAFGEPAEQFAPFLPDVIRQFVEGRLDALPEGDESGLFLVYDVDARRELTVYEILGEDPYFEKDLPNFEVLRSYQEHVRAQPLDKRTTERLRDFFNAPVTVGVRDTLRWLLGSRHTRLTWSQARLIIEDCFDKHGHENYLLPETTVYAPAHTMSRKKLEETRRKNQEAVAAFAWDLRKRLPLSLSRALGTDLMGQIAEQILRYHHDYPAFVIEPFSGWISLGMLTFLERLAYYAVSHAARMRYPRRPNVNVAAALYRRGLLSEIDARLGIDDRKRFIGILQQALAAYMLKGGVADREGRLRRYEQVTTTFFTFQERADWIRPGEKLLHVVSLEGLAKPEYRYLLREFPELAEKLVVFFTMVLRFFLDTDFVPDLRPDEAGVNIFILGIWGNITENVIILITESEEDGETHIRIRFVDNKDHFKAYRREVDKDHPLGLAKHGLRLTGPVVEPAMKRAVAEFVDLVYENRNGTLPRPKRTFPEAAERAVEVSAEMVRQGVEETNETIRTMVTDTLDDTTKVISRLVRNVLRKPPAVRRFWSSAGK